MAQITHEKNQKYFAQLHWKGPVAALVIGFLFLTTGKAFFVLVGLAAMAIGGLLLWYRMSGRPTDADLDRQVQQLLYELPGQAMMRLALVPEQVADVPPLVVGGYFLGNIGTTYPGVRRGKDGLLRGNIFEGVAIFFARQELHAFKVQISLVRPHETWEHTDVYFYRDVVSVSTVAATTSVRPIGMKTQVPWRREIFSLTTSGGTSVECSMDAAGHATSERVNAARALVRNHKAEMHDR